MKYGTERKTVDEIAKDIQKECHRSLDYIKSQSNNFNYQDATNAFLFRKLAELQSRIDYLEEKLTP